MNWVTTSSTLGFSKPFITTCRKNVNVFLLIFYWFKTWRGIEFSLAGDCRETAHNVRYVLKLANCLIAMCLFHKVKATKKAIMDLIPPGGYWRDLPLHLQKSYMKGSFHLGGGKQAWPDASHGSQLLHLDMRSSTNKQSVVIPKKHDLSQCVSTQKLTFPMHGTWPAQWLRSMQRSNAIPSQLGLCSGYWIDAYIKRICHKEQSSESCFQG